MMAADKNQAISVWLAPMSGGTDAPFRKQIVQYGVPNVISEMTASQTLLEQRPDVVRRICRHEGNGPWIVQLAGRAPGDMKAAASFLAEAGVDVIDINMGCPARKVTSGASGSALMREPALAQALIEATLEGAGGRPVSLKMRLGWDDHMHNAPEIAVKAAAAGICQVTVHGRTRCQFYKGAADWAAIGQTVKAVDVPVIANGDIVDVQTARKALAQSGASGVMIGRAAMGRAWLPAMIQSALLGRPYRRPSLQRQVEGMVEQIADSVQFYGERLGVRMVRKHVSAFIDATALGASPTACRTLKRELCTLEDACSLQLALRGKFLKGELREAA